MDVGGEIEEVSNPHERDGVAGAGVIAVAVAKDRNSRYAVKWAIQQCMSGGQTLMLIHVRPRVVTIPTPMGNHVPIAQIHEDAVAAFLEGLEAQTNEMLLPYRQMCDIKKVKSEVVVVEDDNVASAIVKQISHLSISKLVLGASSRNAITRRLKGVDVPTSVTKSVPNFCTVYVISKGKLTSIHSATSTVFKTGSLEDAWSLSGSFSDTSFCSSRDTGETESDIEYSPRFYSESLPVQRNQALSNINRSMSCNISNPLTVGSNTRSPRYSSLSHQTSGIQEANEINESRGSYLSRSSEHNGDGYNTPNTEERGSHISSTGLQNLSPIQEVTSSINSAVPSTQNCGLFETTIRDHGILDIPGMDGLYGTLQAEADILDGLEEIDENDSEDNANRRPQNNTTLLELNMMSTSESQMNESLLQDQNDTIFELQKLKLELQHTVGMYNLARQEAMAARIKANELNRQRIQEARKLEAAKAGEEQARAIATREKAKVEVALKQAEAARQLAEREALQRKDAEMRAIRELEERKKAEEALASAHHRYRTYSLQEIQCATDFFCESLKIGEGGYGAVYKCILQHTTVAVKVLRPEATEGIQQFQQEVEVLSRIRHPHMVLLLGACPEHGCLVYEYMANGSLDDRLFCKGNTIPLPWFARIRIAWEVASALLFLHSAKPEPIVHRDLKPANILLDSNLVSKIGDVGLARLLPAMTTSAVTEYKDTVPAGTFCYIDPEYQRTGTLGPKSDVYALGIMLLQLLTARSPMAITYAVETAIEEGSFWEILDKNAGDWPQEALEIARLGLRCAELRRRDRPDLEKDILPELERLKTLAEAQDVLTKEEIDVMPPSHFFCPILQEVMEDPHVAPDGFTYEYKAISTWLESNNTSPMTNLILDHKHLIPNHSLRSAILEWKPK